MDWDQIYATVVDWCTHTGIKIVIALLVLIVSFTLINLITKRMGKRLEKNKKADKTLSRTFVYVLRIVLKIVVVGALIGYLGLDTSGLSALIASLGVAIGLAVNGTLSNFAGGVLIIITRPFKDDDYISALGHEGTVESIRITHTKIRT
ncbi:MAG TPA: mechanosensitive ion channel protein MscS, partial [Clostridiales bacterium]|nr:mechanosensitive ion channel protein MscS [Clostridiales bacterium]